MGGGTVRAFVAGDIEVVSFHRGSQCRIEHSPWEENDSFKDDLILRLEEEVVKLPASRQEIIRGEYQRGKKYKELAEELGISVATVNSLLVSALKRLRQTLGDDPVKLIQLFFLKKKSDLTQ